MRRGPFALFTKVMCWNSQGPQVANVTHPLKRKCLQPRHLQEGDVCSDQTAEFKHVIH